MYAKMIYKLIKYRIYCFCQKSVIEQFIRMIVILNILVGALVRIYKQN